ncbi:MAG: VanW family protein [Patescibacteria group bacterium]
MKLSFLSPAGQNQSGWLKKIVKKNKDGKIDRRWLLLVIVVAFFILAFFLAGFAFAFEVKYRDRFFPGSKIGQISLAGLTKNEASSLISQITDSLEKGGIKITYQNDGKTEIKIAPSITAISDPDLSRQIFRFDSAKTIDDAFAYGRSGNWRQNLSARLTAIIKGKKFSAQFNLDEKTFQKIIEEQFINENQPAQNAKPKITWERDDYQIEIEPEKNGAAVDYDYLINQIKNNLAELDNQPIKAVLKNEIPAISLAEAEAKKYLIEEALATSTPKFSSGEESWTISKNTFAGLLEFKKENEEVALAYNQEKFNDWLLKIAGPSINLEARNAKAEFADGRIIKLVAHQEGRSIDLEKTKAAAEENLAAGIINTVIAVQTTKPEITIETVNDFGIKEIIGTGHSNFKGSPKNRRHNIKNGAEKLNGILIKPGEEFSLIKALGAIDASTGYLPELVIKGNKTIPEYGGGLCQIGTTVFRAAMASGLPITERQSHSYNVPYYLENGLPGTDATIYDPKPDFKFINDTGNYILIQTRIEGDHLYFDFWGQKDGRTVVRTTPKVWGWVSPAPTRIVETLDLKPGEKKCTESSHKGVNASFDYIVTYPDGEEKKTTFTSRYKPWQAVCLVGVEKLSEEQATTTPDIPVTP